MTNKKIKLESKNEGWLKGVRKEESKEESKEASLIGLSRNQLIKKAYENEDLRPLILPLIKDMDTD